MSTSKSRTYHVRSFNPNCMAFDCTGVMPNLSTFFEEEVSKQYEAIGKLVRMKTDPYAIRRGDVTLGQGAAVVDNGTTDTNNGFTVITLRAETVYSDKSELKSIRAAVMDTIKTWAEKSRVRGVRGWRAHAIKKPVFQKNKNTGTYDLKFEVILSNAIFYNDTSVTLESTAAAADLRLLAKQLTRVTIGGVGAINYVHSELGTGRL